VQGSAAATAPYFFLSYAHKSHGETRDDGEANYWVSEFFRDLCRSVERQANLPKGANSGFMDRERRSGNDWPIGVLQALAGCRVFVPLYSPRYFADDYCGKEWSYFARRRSDLSGAQDALIVPGIWDPVETERLPKPARALRFGYRGGDAYEARGLYGIMKVSRYRAEYVRAVSDLAGWIVEAADSQPFREGPAVDHGALESAFGDIRSARGGSVAGRFRITVVAPRRDELPAERTDSSSYGASAMDWRPYAPDSPRTIAEDAADLARSLPYPVEVGDVHQHERSLLADDPRFGPQILIVDPWALLVPRSQQLLQRVNDGQRPWVQVVIPWNAADEESRRARGKLRAVLDATLQGKLAQAASISQMAAQGVPSPGEFELVLRQLIGVVAKRYLANAAAFPPAGETVERPRIS
jgi:FxsC-like protein